MEVTMAKKITQSILVLIIGLLLVAASPLPGIDEGDAGGEKWYCGTLLGLSMFHPAAM